MFGGATFVQLITQEHLFNATVYTRGHRLLDTLNDRTTDYLEVSDVELHRKGSPEDTVAAFSEAIIRKADLHLVIITGSEHEAPRRRFFSYVQKIRNNVFLTVPGYEVRGVMHLIGTGLPNPIAVLAQETGVFFPVTSATASHAQTGVDVVEHPVIMVNKRSLCLFALGEELLA
ncbi:MAG: hypothetical protein ACE5F6_08145 [Anaerolineae bacterium]